MTNVISKHTGMEFLDKFKGTYDDKGDISSGLLFIHEGWGWGR